MLIEALNKIFLNYKLFSACSIGTNKEVNSHLIDIFDFVTIFDYSSTNSLECYSQIQADNSRQHMPERSGDHHLFKEFDYLDNKYDFAFVSNTFPIDEVRRFFDRFVSDKTKFILIPSKLVYNNVDGYRSTSVIHLDSVYTLYYLDLISHEISKGLDGL